MDTNRVKFMNTYIDSLTADEAIKVVDEYVAEKIRNFGKKANELEINK